MSSSPCMRYCILRLLLASCLMILIYNTIALWLPSEFDVGEANIEFERYNSIFVQDLSNFSCTYFSLPRRSSALVSRQQSYTKNSTCKPLNKFGFLKTHKCGSTTVQNILLRYVVNRGLNVIVPKQGD